MTQPIASNTFDEYFAPIELSYGTISWDNGMMKVDISRSGHASYYYESENHKLLDANIPSSLSIATYTFRFKVVPQERIIENRVTNIFWWGAGYVHAEYYGDVQHPLFRVYIDASDNHLYLIFDGEIQVEWGVGGRRPIWEFREWKVDLGDVSGFYDWKQFTVVVDVADKSFTKIVIGSNDIPFPPGYTKLKPNLLQNTILYGMNTGRLFGNASTNIQFLVDDVYLYPEYYIPVKPSGLGWLFLLIIIGGIMIGTSYMSKKKGATH